MPEPDSIEASDEKYESLRNKAVKTAFDLNLGVSTVISGAVAGVTLASLVFSIPTTATSVCAVLGAVVAGAAGRAARRHALDSKTILGELTAQRSKKKRDGVDGEAK